MEVSTITTHASSMQPIMDEKQRPPAKLWPDSVEFVREAILSKMTEENEKLNVVFCPSGNFSQDCSFVKNIFSSDRFKSWAGDLKFRLINLNCNTEEARNLIEAYKNKLHRKGIAVLAAVYSGGETLKALIFGNQTEEEEREAQNDSLLDAAMWFFVTIFSASVACIAYKDYQDSKIEIGEPGWTYKSAEREMNSIWTKIQKSFFENLSCEVSFFPDTDLPKIGPVDLLFGCNGSFNFEQSKGLALKKGGKVIVIGEQPQDSNASSIGPPYFLQVEETEHSEQAAKETVG